MTAHCRQCEQTGYEGDDAGASKPDICRHSGQGSGLLNRYSSGRFVDELMPRDGSWSNRQAESSIGLCVQRGGFLFELVVFVVDLCVVPLGFRSWPPALDDGAAKYRLFDLSGHCNARRQCQGFRASRPHHGFEE